MHAPYLRAKARQLRAQNNWTIDQLAERLALPRTTIYSWVRDIPIPPTPPRKLAQRRAAAATSRKHRLLREKAYAEGRAQFRALAEDRTFRDFVALYIAEGSKRNRNAVAICNSDPAVLAIALTWMTRLTSSRLDYWIQYHADQEVEDLKAFWSRQLTIDRERIRCLRKSNSNQLSGRTWRSPHGVLTIRACDTLFRARLQAWIDCLRAEWLDSAAAGA